MFEKYPESQAYHDYEVEKQCKLYEAQGYYNLIGNHFKWKADAIYEDAILDLVGTHGLNLLREFRLIEGCGSINGRKLYAM